MKQELAVELIQSYPKLYYKFSPTGFKCADGWFEILKSASQSIEDKLEGDKQIYAEAVYEKYGSLRIDLNRHQDDLEMLIQELEAKSEQICEICGQPGEMKSNAQGWDSTRCETCPV